MCYIKGTNQQRFYKHHKLEKQNPELRLKRNNSCNVKMMIHGTNTNDKGNRRSEDTGR